MDIAEQFRAVLDAEEHWLAAVSRAGDFTDWRSRVVREVMDQRSPYALALRRGHGASRQSEFLHSWQALITETLERVARGEADGVVAGAGPGTGAGTAPATGDPEALAIAILAALHGGATLSWLAEDGRSLEAALDIALAPVISPRVPDGPGDRRPG